VLGSAQKEGKPKGRAYLVELVAGEGLRRRPWHLALGSDGWSVAQSSPRLREAERERENAHAGMVGVVGKKRQAGVRAGWRL